MPAIRADILAEGDMHWIAAGPVIFQEGDYFGRTVNLAARMAEYARPGEVLVSQEVVDAAEGGR
jgi:class 3 adenylate cyclase